MGEESIDTAGNHRVDQALNGVPMCFVCHNVTVGSGNTPWARNWPVASCTACHGSSRSAGTCQ